MSPGLVPEDDGSSRQTTGEPPYPIPWLETPDSLPFPWEPTEIRLDRTLEEDEEASSARKTRKTRKKAPYTTPSIRKALMEHGLLFFLPCMTKKQWKTFLYTKGVESDEDARNAWGCVPIGAQAWPGGGSAPDKRPMLLSVISFNSCTLYNYFFCFRPGHKS